MRIVTNADRERVLDLVRRHGHNATSFQVLELGFQYWFDGDACVAYVDAGHAWVAAGAPLAPLAEIADVTRRFVRAAREQGRRASFFGVESRFLEAVESSSDPAIRSLLVGEQASWDPSRWEDTLQSTPSLREQLRRARAKGVMVRSAGAADVQPDGAARRPMEQLIERWLVGRGMPPMGFLVDVQPFDWPEERRFWLAERDGRLVGFLVAVPIPSRSGWLLEDLIRDPSDAPNGTTELLVDAAMRALAAEGSRHVTLGLAPLAGEIEGWLRILRDRASLLYDFHGVKLFKAKLRPSSWEAIYLAHPDSQSALSALRDVLTAFARGSMLRFGLHAILRGPTFVVALLAGLLIPWTILLAFAAPDASFPAAWVRWAWVAFDVGLASCLFALARRWRSRLGTIVALLVTTDAGVTLLEAIRWNLPRLRGASDAVVVVLACLAPAVAAVILWHARAARAEDSHPNIIRRDPTSA